MYTTNNTCNTIINSSLFKFNSKIPNLTWNQSNGLLMYTGTNPININISYNIQIQFIISGIYSCYSTVGANFPPALLNPPISINIYQPNINLQVGTYNYIKSSNSINYFGTQESTIASFCDNTIQDSSSKVSNVMNSQSYTYSNNTNITLNNGDMFNLFFYSPNINQYNNNLTNMLTNLLSYVLVLPKVPSWLGGNIKIAAVSPTLQYQLKLTSFNCTITQI